MVQVVIPKFNVLSSTINLYRVTLTKMKANRQQTAAKLTASKIRTHIMVRVVTKYGTQCLHQVVKGLMSRQ